MGTQIQAQNQPRRKLMQREATAYHEAGHAVAAWRLRVRIGRKGVSIISSEDFFGTVHLRKGFRGDPVVEMTAAMRVGLENQIITTLAGEAAQRKYRPSSVRSHHGSVDRKNVTYLLCSLVGSDRECRAYYKWLQIRAEQLVENTFCWTAIEAVAKTLMQRNRLSAKEVSEVIQGCLNSVVERQVEAARVRRVGGVGGPKG
jgi:hypothetical protein